MANMNLLTYNCEIVECVHPIDLNSAAQTGDYIDMADYDAVCVVNYQGTEGAAVTVTITQCTLDADAGGDSKALLQQNGGIKPQWLSYIFTMRR